MIGSPLSTGVAQRAGVCCRAVVAALSFHVAIHSAAETPPVRYTGSLDVSPTADGGLRPVVGVHNIQVYRANRTAPTHADQLAHTYLHAPMLCYWKGKFYLEYLSGPKNEHDNPTDTSLTSSVDGITWDAPRTLFPAFALPDGTKTIAHQRMGFYVAPNSRLLALSFYGRSPSPNEGDGIGRAVREIHADGSFGPIYFIRLNAKSAFPNLKPPYPLYTASPDQGFIAACDALLANKLMTAQWWEEEQHDDTDFYRVRGKALSYVMRPDGSVLGIWKNRLVATTNDRGETWTEKVFAENVPNNASKYWLQRTADGRYGLVLNPTNRNRYPLAIATSDDCATFSNLWTVHAELPDQRYGGYLKNMGPQYVRGIAEGNGTPPDATRAFWLTYSVNKEDLWVARVPAPVSATAAPGPIRDDFESAAPGALPAGWNVYSPLWAPVRVVDADNRRVLELRDEDPVDYARADRVFPATHGVKITFKVFARQSDARLEIDLLDGAGLRPVRLAFEENGRLRVCHEAQWLDAGPYETGRWHEFTLDIPVADDADRCAILLDGKSPLPRPAFFTDPVASVERLSFRTGRYRQRGYGGRDLPGSDAKSPAAVFLIDDVAITPLPPAQ
jgi:hypothetical protein